MAVKARIMIDDHEVSVQEFADLSKVRPFATIVFEDALGGEQRFVVKARTVTAKTAGDSYVTVEVEPLPKASG